MTQPPNQPPYQQPSPGTPPPPPPQGAPPPPPAQGQYMPPPAAPYGQPAYGQPAYGGYALPESQNAKNAMIWGIVGLVAIFVCTPAALIGIMAIKLGNSAKAEIAASGGRLGGESNANLGVIFGWISTIFGALGVLFLILYIFLFAAIFSSTTVT